MLEGGIFVTQENNKISKIPRNIKYLLNHCLMQKKKKLPSAKSIFQPRWSLFARSDDPSTRRPINLRIPVSY